MLLELYTLQQFTISIVHKYIMFRLQIMFRLEIFSLEMFRLEMSRVILEVSLIPSLPCFGTQTFKLCSLESLVFFSHVSTVKSREKV